MSTRAYDYIVTVANVAPFAAGNTVNGTLSNAYAEIIRIEGSALKLRMVNVYNEFAIGEQIYSNSIILPTYNTFINHTSNVNGISNTFILPLNNVLSDSVIVYANSDVIDKDKYVILSNNTIKFLPILSSNSNSVNQNYTVYPSTDVSSLLVQAVSANIESYRFIASNGYNYVTTAQSYIEEIQAAPYIAEKNSSSQTPLVKLYSIYYPGEWYPPKNSGNPGKSGDGFPWPYGFPIRYAEIIGESYSDFNYSVVFNNRHYKVVAVNSSDISSDSSGRINEISLELSNFDGVIARLVESNTLVGYNSSNSTVSYVNGELVRNIDPRTDSSNVHHTPAFIEQRGANAAWDYESTIAHGDVWTPLKLDTRDLLGAVVEIKLTYAKFLDFWPEYSVARSISGNAITVASSVPYRVGDTVSYGSSGATTVYSFDPYLASSTEYVYSTILDIQGNTLYLENNPSFLPNIGDRIYILNPDADKDAFVEHVFTINRLDELDEFVAKFSLTNWLQYFKMNLPRRKYYTTTCPWKYKGPECKYQVDGVGFISGTNPPIQANGFFTYSDVPTANITEDICSKTLRACSLRKNTIHFGGFPAAYENE
jgi:phage-related protein